MATKNFVPRATGQGQIGTTSKKWLRHNAISGSFTHVSASVFQVTNLLGDISGSTSSTGSFGRLEVAGNSSLTGDLTIGGNITIGYAATDSLVISADLSSSLIPNASDIYNLGSATQRWNNLFLSGSVAASGGPHSFFGNIGVGTTVPSQLLTVAGNISGSGNLDIDGNMTASGDVYLGGSVGVGTVNPPQKLTIKGNISGSGNLDIDGNVTASGDAYFGSNVGIGTNNPDARLHVSASKMGHGLYVSGSAGSPQVGIGTTSPGVALEVIGTVSGSATSTGSFGRIETAGNINTVGRIYESGTSVIDHATAMAIVFG